MTVAEQLLKLNIGCGDYPLAGWCNLDAAPGWGVDLVLAVPPLPQDNESVGEIFAGHFLEHLSQADGRAFLAECWRVLVPGGRLGVVVPDMHEVMRRYISSEHAPMEFPSGHVRDLRDLDHLNECILFSTAQPSHHLWSYDLHTLGRALGMAGFTIVGEIDRLRDPRLSTPQWYQAGLDGRKV